MRLPENSWPNTPAGRGALLFAQLMREMLSNQTFESFRVYSLGTIARLDESLSLIEDIRRNRLPAKALDPLIGELHWSLARDPATSTALIEEIAHFKERYAANQISLTETKHFLRFFHKKFSNNYQLNLENNIINGLGDEKNRINLRHSTGFYCSHIVNIGYSKRYILKKVEEFFSAGTLREHPRRSSGSSSIYSTAQIKTLPYTAPLMLTSVNI